jgi:hypothetical protein
VSTRFAGFVVLLLALGGLGFSAWQLSSTDLPALLSGESGHRKAREGGENRRAPPAAKRRPEAPKRGNGDRGTGKNELVEQVRSTVAGIPGTVWRAIRIPVAAVLIVAFALLVSRWVARRSRRYVRVTLLPHRSGQAEPEDVRRMLESWHQQLLQRWWRRLYLGQPGVALEVVTDRGPDGRLVGRISIVCPDELQTAVEGTLLACYPDSRVLPGEPLPELRRLVRLKKRHLFVRALRSLEEQGRNVVDATLGQMAALDGPSVVQYSLAPTPALFDRYSRWRYSSVERDSEGARVFDPSAPGLRSEVLGQELEGGLRVQHRPLFFCDIRVASSSLRACTAIAGTLRGESAAENRLVIRHTHRVGRGPRFLRRLREGSCNPLPGWRRGVLSSSELSALWHSPSPGLTTARIARATVPRLPAPPELSRAEEHRLMRDDQGPVGILPEDKTDGLGLIGGQKTGKTSVLCRTVQADALDDDCALVVLVPKPGDALQALSMVPEGRTVRYLDLEHPEFGINPLLSEGDPAMVADKVVDAFRDVNVEGDIRGSSDRYLRQAAQAAIGASRAGVLEGAPTLWHMYRLLIPAESRFRERVVEALFPDPRFVDTATFFGHELPGDLRGAPSQTVAKLDAPRNKILRVLVESLDKVLRHPVQISLDEVVRRREVLIVDGKMGTFGADNCRVMMQFILNSLYGALQRQQQLPETERARVALKVDEAHLILNESFADALATLRSAGLEVVAAWQYSEQIQDPKVRSGMLSLLRQRCMFSMGETAEAREMASIAMSVYTDMIRGDTESQSLLRITPDAIFNLPNHHAVCSWICRGARTPAFIAETIPLETNEEIVSHHLAVQRASGGRVPERLPDPLPDFDRRGLREMPTEVISAGRGADAATNGAAQPSPQNGHPAESTSATPRQGENGGGSNGDAPTVDQPPDLVFEPAATSVDASNERQGDPPPRGAPDSFVELDLDDVRGMIWDKVSLLPPDRRPEPTQRELEILASLWSHRFLFATQIWRRWWAGSSLRASQQILNRMSRCGWVRRFKFKLGERGAQQRVYCLTRAGFELAQERSGRRGPHIDPDAKWREPEVNDPRRVLRDLHVNGWVLALHGIGPKAIVGWRGPREGRINPPRRRERGEWLDIAPTELELGGSRRLRDYEASRFEPVSPDATVEVRIPVGDSPLRLDLLVELDRARSAASSEERLRRYDGLISGWASLLERYRALGTPPVVVFVCEDEQRRDKLVRIADKAVTARLAKAGADEAEWPCPGRKGMFFAVERDVHMGSLEAVQLPEHPPAVRMKLSGKPGRACRPWRVHVIEPRLLRGR